MKSVVFAVVIAIVGCYMGFVVRGGAEGVGEVNHDFRCDLAYQHNTGGLPFYGNLLSFFVIAIDKDPMAGGVPGRPRNVINR